jgi:hypothetical protein
MPPENDDTTSDWQVIDEWNSGAGWIADPDGDMQRASHVLDGPEGQWLLDPVDCDGLDEWLDDRGDVRGVALLLDRHTRDAAAVARRHDVAVHVPDFMDVDLDAPVETMGHGLPDSEYGIHELVDNRFWEEAALYAPESETLVVPEAVGTASFFRTRDERLGVHPVLRLNPPRSLGQLRPERVLVGHGTGVFEDAASALANALRGSRRRAPRLYAKTARELLP